jgi:large conductance mechanosensitive channel
VADPRAADEEVHQVKSLIAEFKEFISKGDVVMVAVGLVMALTFKTIIDSLIQGVINPIVAAIVGEQDLSSWGFDLGDSFVSIGLVINAVIYFISVAIILFLIVKAYNRWKGPGDEEAAPTEVELLTEIRDSLRNRPTS